MKLYIVTVQFILQMINFFSNIINGWKSCYYNYSAWWFLLKYPYNHFQVWEFFSSLNPESTEPYVLYVSYDDFERFSKLLEEAE